MKQIFDFNFAVAIPNSNQKLRNLFFIDDQPGAGDTVALDVQILSNADHAAVTLLHQSNQTVSASNHHFELYFDPDTLPDIANIEIKPSSDWAILAYQHTDTTGDPKAGVSIYFLHKGSNDLVLQPGDELSLTLQKFSAVSKGDVRTSTVNFNFNTDTGYLRIGKSPGNQFFPGQHNPYATSETKVVDILNKSRSIHAPLEVDFYSTNSVLNDESTLNELEVRIVNLSTTALPMVSTGGTKATFHLSFDSTGAWAFADALAQSKFKVDGGNDFGAAWDSESSRWKLTPKASTWAAGGSVSLTISKVVSNKATGRSLLHLDYQQIPGYGDASFVVPVEKSALCLVGDKVGVGTTDPGSKLEIRGNDDALRLWGTEGNYDYGAKLNFGDGDYAYLQEDQDDHIKLHARTGISLEIPEGDASIGGDTNISGNASISGNTDVGGGASISGDTTLGGKASISGNTDIGGDASITGSADIGGIASISGDTTLGGKASIRGNTDIGGDASVSGNTDIGGDASISGKADIGGNASISGNTDIGGDASISGDVTVGGSISNSVYGEIHTGDVYTWGYLWTQWSGVYVKLRDVSGNAEWSDRELKKEIRSIDRPLDKLLELQGCEYRWDEKKHFGRPEDKVDPRPRMGLIAQDVESVLPDLVEQREHVTRKKLDDGGFDEKVYEHKAIDYSQLHALIIEAIKEIKVEKDQEITELKQRIAELEKKPSA